MKKKYTKPEIEITAFTTEDIITASSTGMDIIDDTVGTGVKVDIGDENDWQ